MPEITPELMMVMFAAFAAGLVRGFSGFGTSLTFVPLASGFMRPADAVVMISIVDGVTMLALMPNAIRLAEHRKVISLAAGAAFAIPIGAWLLATMDTAPLRLVICVLVFASVIVLATGWRYQKQPSVATGAGIGAISGFMGGIGGLFGPAVMVFLMGREDAAKNTRANIITFLAWMYLIAAIVFAAMGLIRVDHLWRALTIAPAFMLGVLVGVQLFRLASDQHYRMLAYGLIGIAAIIGLPMLDPYLR